MTFGSAPAMIPDDPIGIDEIARLLRVTRRQVHELTFRADFPLPVSDLRSGRAWRQKDVESWARDTGFGIVIAT